MFDITTRDIKYLQGVGPQRAAMLNKELNIYSLHDLLYYFPYKYVDRSRLYYIHEIDGNMPYIQLKGQILSFETVGEGRQRRLVAHFSDGTGVVDLVWFQGIKYLMGRYKVHEEYIVFGKPTVFNGRINVAHPDIEQARDLAIQSFVLERDNTVYIDADGETTSIGCITEVKEQYGNGAIYDLQGRKVLQPQKGGIVIKNGKKFFVK